MMDKNRVINTFKNLVEIDSISLKEREMADRLSESLNNLGYEVIEDNTGDKIGGNAGNIIATKKGKDKYPSIMFSAHMDRVKPGTDIKPVLRNGYIKSKGDKILGADDIAGVTGIMEALKIIEKNNIAHGKIKIIFTVAEELGLLGAKNLKDTYLKDVDFGIVYDAEGRTGKIIDKGPAKAKFNAIIKGKSSHAGINPGKGINAIKITSLAISTMNLGQIDHETTANIGVINGGIASNIVPDLVELEGEARSLDQNKLEKQIKHMRQVIQKYVDKYNGEVEFNIDLLYNNFSLEKDIILTKLLKSAARKTGLKPKFINSCGGNDANIFYNRGLPTTNIATGAENVHSSEEKLKIDYLLDLVKYTVNIIKMSRKYKKCMV